VIHQQFMLSIPFSRMWRGLSGYEDWRSGCASRRMIWLVLLFIFIAFRNDWNDWWRAGQFGWLELTTDAMVLGSAGWRQWWVVGC
jgi:hypothetical protein